MKALKDAHVAILGLGLMGGSLAAAIQGKCRSITGCDPLSDSLEFALAQGWIQAGTQDSRQALQDADLVILGAPVRAILVLLEELAQHFPPGCLVMDLGSTKLQITRQMERLPVSVHCLGSHPMCGKEKAGVRHADAGLFHGHKFLLTPLERTDPVALEAGKELALAAGAEPRVLDAARHDRLVATASHLPYLVACGLVEAAQVLARQDPLVWEIAASGFRDTSRLAASNVVMMADILLTNRTVILETLADYQYELNQIAEMLEDNDEDGLVDLLRQLQSIREGLFL